jgi:AmmeMemoRadiSam system protein B
MVEGWMGDLRERASPSRGRLVGAIAPHIDFGRGSVSYAHAYRDLAACPADLFVILGTDHFGDTLFAATRNDFETPLGRVPVARDVLERIEAAFIGDLRDGELQHLGEHTIEFQVVLLQHFLGGRPFEIVPLLCGGLQEEMEAGVPASENAEVHSLVECLREIAAGGERSVCVLASADLSHVGPNFGGDRPLTPGYLEKIADFDREILASAVAGDPDGMFRLVAGRRNDTNICGLSPMYVMVSALGACRGQLLDYRQATAPDRKQSVTFAAATFWR